MNLNSASNPPRPQLSQLRILSVREVCLLVAYSRTHLYRLERKGQFPRRVKIGPARVGFRLADIEQWLAELPYADRPKGDDDDDLGSPPSMFPRR